MIQRVYLRAYGTCQVRRLFSEHSRRRGDGSETDAFEERAAASQERYFRKLANEQLEALRKQKEREKAEKEADNEKEKSAEKPNDKSPS